MGIGLNVQVAITIDIGVSGLPILSAHAHSVEDEMRKLAAGFLMACLATALWAQGPEPLKLKAGDTAPDFTLLAFDGKDVKAVSLHDFKGKKSVVLAFYVFAFTGG